MYSVIEEKIKNVKLTKSQAKIAEYFLKNPERVGIGSSMEIAREIGVSDVSVIRFSRAIGYDGFTEMKNDILNHMVNSMSKGNANLSLEERFYANQLEHENQITKQEYINLIQYDIQKTIEQNDTEKFEQVVKMLLKSKHKYIAGRRGSMGVADRTAWLLRFVLDHVISITDAGTGAIGSLQDISKEDCLIMFSVSRYYKGDIELVKIAKKRKAKICVITDSFLSPFVSYADVILVAETKQLSFFHSAISLTTIAEYIIARVAQCCPDAYYEKVKERDALTKYQRL